MSDFLKGWFHLLTIFILLLFHSCPVQSVAVMSVDIGSEWMKVAIVSPRIPMEIALNKESKRKTPVAIAFRGEERSFGEDALNIGVRYPANCFVYFLDLLGKDINNPVVKMFQKRFPYYDVIPDPVRNTVLFRLNNETVYSPEELTAMLLVKAKEFAQDSARQPVQDVVLVVPNYFTHVERQALLISAKMADLKVLQLMNDYTAAALNYGIFRIKDFNETAQYVMLYDMGAYSTSAVIVNYQIVKTKEKGFVETNPQLSIVGIGYDRTLGGLEMQIRLRDYFAQKFNELKKTEKNVFEHPRAMAKLFKEAGRLKIILSANVEYSAQIENLIDDIDFTLRVTRTEFENLCKDLIVRVKGPVEQALKTSQLSLDVISQIILVGAGTRVPIVQEQLMAVVKTDLSKNLNTDEAAVLGAAYKAADLSVGFKVKKFVTKDALLLPIQASFDRADPEKESKVITRTLFNVMNPYPQKKVLTFNKHSQNFDFIIHYGDLQNILPEYEIKAIGSKQLCAINLTGVPEAIEKHRGENVESKGIKAHFHLDESGFLILTSVEYHVEKKVSPEELPEQENGEESTFSKLSSTISKLFHATEDELKETNPDIKVPHTEGDSSEQTKPVKEEQGEKKLNDTISANFENKTEAVNKTSTETPREKVQKKPKIILLKEPITTAVHYLTSPHLKEDEFHKSAEKIRELNMYDQKKFRREGALNALESTIIDIRNKMENSEFLDYAEPDEAKRINKVLHEISEWLDEHGYSAKAEVLEYKLSELETAVKSVQTRYNEYAAVPEALRKLEETMANADKFLSGMKDMTNYKDPVQKHLMSDEEIDLFTSTKNDVMGFEVKLKETRTWKEVNIKIQNDMPKNSDPILSHASIKEKMDEINREVEYLKNKAKNYLDLVKANREREKQEKLKQKKVEEDTVKPDIPEQVKDTKQNQTETVEEENVEKDEL